MLLKAITSGRKSSTFVVVLVTATAVLRDRVGVTTHGSYDLPIAAVAGIATDEKIYTNSRMYTHYGISTRLSQSNNMQLLTR